MYNIVLILIKICLYLHINIEDSIVECKSYLFSNVLYEFLGFLNFLQRLYFIIE